MKITKKILEAYLACRTKGYLELRGETGTKSDYEVMTDAVVRASREEALLKLVTRYGEEEACRGLLVTVEVLMQRKPLLADATIEDELLSIRCDALKRTEGASTVGSHHYLPVLHNHGDKIGRQQKLLLAVVGLVLARLQGVRPAIGWVAGGPDGLLCKVLLSAKLYQEAERVLDEVKSLQAGGDPPKLALNDHCHVCEFRPKCRKQAEQADDISLLGGISEKELKRYHRKGIFTLTQLSCTFRARKRSNRVKRQDHDRYPALQALAIREKKIHVYGTPDLPSKPVQLFFDAEGVEGAGFVYLLGVLVVEGDSHSMHSFWADDPNQEVQIFDSFLDLLAGYEDFSLFHYGAYEKALLRRMRNVVTRSALVDRASDKAVNVLSLLRSCVYFPTFSNGLKDVGRYLGCTWKDEKSSGLQSLVWRARWEQDGNPVWKNKLVTYNAEDCAALKKTTECIQTIGDAARSRSAGAISAPSSSTIAWADEVGRPSIRREFCRVKFTLQDFDYVNSCAYFDYQRDKVFLRTSKVVKKASRKRCTKVAWPKATRVVTINDDSCPTCGGKRITQLTNRRQSKLAFDLKVTAGGILRQVIRCRSTTHWCQDCRMKFSPVNFKRRDKHLPGLKSWAIYQHIVHRINLSHLEVLFRDCFSLRVNRAELQGIRALMAHRYQKTCARILARIVGGKLLHADETEINLQNDKGYVWVMANLEDVLFMYKPSREAAFLKPLLQGFTGVLVSDFYSGYDSIDCPQQKCLVHLIRDFNKDLLENAFDGELKELATGFGKLLRSIVATIDKHGLFKRHLQQHKAEVSAFFRTLELRGFRSDVAEAYRMRLLKNEAKLFVFLDYDGIPWNNNPAEHAIKSFAYFRQFTDGQMGEQGLTDYLVLLSVQQTCVYHGVSFLKFLLSQEEDVEEYCRRGRNKNPPPTVEVYPKNFVRNCFKAS